MRRDPAPAPPRARANRRRFVRLRNALAGANEPKATLAERRMMGCSVRARVGHLIPRRQTEVERAARLLRIHFINRRRRSPKRGMLHWLMLVGDYADATRPDRELGDISDYEIWAFVDHDAYKGMNRYWGLARRAVANVLGGRAEITLSVFTIDEMERIRASGNRFLTSRYDGGIVLYDRAMDGPKDAEGKAIETRLGTWVAMLPRMSRDAFRRYREHGLDYRRIANLLAVSEARAEMHLADALGTLMALLANDALPRSLRPRLEPHPRNNLNLFHRPQDYDRILAVALYRRALAFAEVMRTEGASRSMVIDSASYAVEFALKAFLLRAGFSDEWNRRHIGADLEGALGLAESEGLGVAPARWRRLAWLLGHYRIGRKTARLMGEVEAAMPLPKIITTTLRLLDHVGRITRYAGLPPEVDG